MKRAELIIALRSLKPALAGEGVAHLAMFGSRARGDERADSDVDLLVDVDPRATFSLLNLVGVEQIVSDTTGLEANAIVARGLDQSMRSVIEKDLIPVF